MGASDESLMLAYAGGDAAAFDALYLRHKGPLYRFVLRSVKATGEAEEIFQDVWMRAIEARARYEPRAKFTTWLYTIAHNRLVDHWRSKGLTVVVPLEGDGDDAPTLDPPAGPSAEPHRRAEGRESVARLLAALAALPAAQREAFLLHEENGLPVAEIAAVTGVPEETAKSRLRYAMNKLREAMGDD
jgi:RNA polymerase sigma-70 factor (ECF subfamily)